MKVVGTGSVRRGSWRHAASRAALGAILALGSPGTAFAQQAAAEEEDKDKPREGMDTIVVTATKVATNVQDTPIAITAVTAEALEARQLTTTVELGSIVPNAAFRKAEGVYGPAVTAFVRGVGQADPQFSGEAGIAYYIDDIYYPFLFGSQFDLLELDHVEVLRGPQGTLFGRNSIGGAISMVSRKPSLTEPTASIAVIAGDYSRKDVRATMSFPLTSNLAVSASFVGKTRKGYQQVLDFTCQMHKNGTPELAGKLPFLSNATTFAAGLEPKNCVVGHLGGEDTKAYRVALYWEPASNVEFSVSGDYLDQNDESAAEYAFETNYALTYGRQPDGTVNEALANRNFITTFDQFSIPGAPFRWDERFNTGNPYQTYDNFCDPLPAGTRITGNTYYNGSIFRGGRCSNQHVKLKNRGVQGKLVVGLTPDIDFTALLGYRMLDLAFTAASDGTPLNDNLIHHAFDEEHVTGELRLTGQHELLSWVAGLFYYSGTALHIGAPQGVQAGTQRFQNDTYDPTAWAAYANVVFHATDRFNITGGIRYSDDQKDVDFNSINDGTPPGQTTFVAGGVSTIFFTHIATKRWDWKAGLDYKLNDNLLVYTSAGSGYSLPGFNVRPSQPGQEGQTPAEALISYEVGAKSELFDRRLRINAAAFYMKFTERPGSYGGQEAQLTADLMHNVAGTRTVIPAGPAGTQYETAFSTCRAYNAATDGPVNPDAGIGVNCVTRIFSYKTGGEIKGVEAEIEAEPIDDLLITASFGHTRSKSDEANNIVGTPTEAQRRATTSRSWTASGGVQYRFDTPALAGAITPRLDWFYRGKAIYSAENPQYDQGPVSTFNARLTYHNESQDFDVSLGVTNLFDKFYYQNKFLRAVLGSAANIGQPAAPREWSLSVKKQF